MQVLNCLACLRPGSQLPFPTFSGVGPLRLGAGLGSRPGGDPLRHLPRVTNGPAPLAYQLRTNPPDTLRGRLLLRASHRLNVWVYGVCNVRARKVFVR